MGMYHYHPADFLGAVLTHNSFSMKVYHAFEWVLNKSDEIYCRPVHVIHMTMINYHNFVFTYLIQVEPFSWKAQTIGNNCYTNTFSQKWYTFINFLGTKACINILCFLCYDHVKHCPCSLFIPGEYTALRKFSDKAVFQW